MASSEPVDIDGDGTGDGDYEWGDDLMNDLEGRFNQLREFDKTLDESRDETIVNMATSTKNALKETTTELVANQIYDKLKSVQSALSDLLTTSAKHGTFSGPSMKRGLN